MQCNGYAKVGAKTQAVQCPFIVRRFIDITLLSSELHMYEQNPSWIWCDGNLKRHQLRRLSREQQRL